jgi:tetratricopeptide (TPR) repeat protein/predicted Ser/Thr protein kinase
VRSGSDEVTLAPPGDETIHADERSMADGPATRWIDLARGTSIGRYVVLERIGSGGMGVVYAAFDPELDRKIALKLVADDGTAGSAAGNRLAREAQAMAKLDHENVVTVHDVGSWGEQVFIAMEYLDGGTLGQWMRAAPRPWREVLDTLRRAGAGLAAAHDAGIVHRDFKPDNVLLGRDGRVRVVDFGLARAIGGDVDRTDGRELGKSLDGLDRQLTMTGARIGTPAYMSPEQHRGEPADAASDQFSFCVTAFEAFYGQAPFAGVTLAELASNVIDGVLREPPRREVPSWIFAQLVRGLQRDPARRHPSMRALLEALSIDRDARRRARVRTAGIVVGVVALVGGAYAQSTIAARPCREGEAKLEAVWNPTVREAGRAAFGNAGSPGADSTWTDTALTLDAYGAAWVEMYGQACRATHVDGDQSPALLDRRMLCLERRRVQLGAAAELFAEADAAVVERASKVTGRLGPIAECADVDALLAELPPPDPAIAERVAGAVATLEEVGTLRAVGRFARARELVEGLQEEVDALGHPPLRTEFLYLRSAAASDVGEIELAQQLAYETVEAAATSHHLRLAADAWISLAILTGVSRQDFALVEPILHAARAAVIQAGNDDLRRARLLATWGTILLLREDYAAAEAKLAEGYALFAARGAGDLDALETRQRLALVYHGQARYDEAQAILEEVLVTLERRRGPDHPSVGEVVGNLARLHKARGDTAAALPLYERALGILEKALGAKHPSVATAHNSLSNTLRTLGRYDEAEAHLDAAAAIEALQYGPNSEAAASNLHARALLSLARGRAAEALAPVERAIALWDATLGPEHPRVAYGLTTQGRILVALHRADEAIAPLERALALRAAKDAAPPTEVAATHVELAHALWDSGRDRSRARTEAEAARALLREAGRSSELAELDAWLAAH